MINCMPSVICRGVTLEKGVFMATIAVIFGSITGLLAAFAGFLLGATHSMTALIWLLASLCGFGGSFLPRLFRRGRPGQAGDAIAADLRALSKMRSALQE